MSLDAYAKTLQSQLHHKLDYSLSATADYILERRSIRFFPLAGDKFAPNSTRTCSFRLTGSGYIDPSTVRLCGTFHNKKDVALQPTSAAHGLWSEARIIAAGSPIETVQNVAKVQEMIFRMMNPQAKVRYCDQSFPLQFAHATAANNSNVERGVLKYKEIPKSSAAGANPPFQMELLALGLFHGNTKLIPLRFMPMILEFTLGGLKQMFTDGGTDLDWELDGMHVLCDELLLDSSVDAALAERLSAGTPLNIPINTHICFHQAIPAGSGTPTIVVNRALSKLNEVWCSFAKSVSETNGTKSPLVSEFYKGTTNGGASIANGSTTMSLQVGDRRWPYYEPVNSDQSFMYELEKAIGAVGSQHKNIGLTLENYVGSERAFITAIDLESCPPSQDISFTGLNSRDASATTLSWTGLGDGTGVPQACFVVLVAQIIVSLALDSTTVLE